MHIRMARAEDGPFLLELRNDEQTRRFSVNTESVTEEEHRAWLRASLEKPDRVLLIAELAGEPIGTVRFDRESLGVWETSITIAPSARGRGLAGKVLAAGEDYLAGAWTVREFWARIRTDNTASFALFTAAGYARRQQEGDFLLLRKGR